MPNCPDSNHTTLQIHQIPKNCFVILRQAMYPNCLFSFGRVPVFLHQQQSDSGRDPTGRQRSERRSGSAARGSDAGFPARRHWGRQKRTAQGEEHGNRRRRGKRNARTEGSRKVTGVRRERAQWSEVRERQMRDERKNEHVAALFGIPFHKSFSHPS